jgi:hypothetical protein
MRAVRGTARRWHRDLLLNDRPAHAQAVLATGYYGFTHLLSLRFADFFNSAHWKNTRDKLARVFTA